VNTRHARHWLEVRPEGLYCPPGDIYIDPTRPVPRAAITHGHADHARSGHGHVLATPETLRIMACRYGEANIGASQAAAYGETIALGDVRLTLFPAGHILGSAQIRLEHGGTCAVISGDYKRRIDPTCAGFELVPCDFFVTEATFGLPVFRHPPTAGEIEKLLRSLVIFPERCHLIGVYSLGKCQRVIAELRRTGYERPIYLHGALIRLCELYQAMGVGLGDIRPVMGMAKDALKGEIVLAPPSSIADRLDADPRAGQAAIGGAAARHLRPCRLGRADGDRLGDERRGDLGHAWTRGGAGLLCQPAWHQGARLVTSRL
jgi:putative mRNA 3-end processing factor